MSVGSVLAHSVISVDSAEFGSVTAFSHNPKADLKNILVQTHHFAPYPFIVATFYLYTINFYNTIVGILANFSVSHPICVVTRVECIVNI